MDGYVYAIIILFFIWMVYKQFAPVKGLRNLNAQQFKEESKGKTVIDVREPHEFKQGHIKGAVNIPLSQLQNRLGEIAKDQPVYLYCRSGMRSKQAGKILGRHGYQSAHLIGGISAWDGPTTK